MSKKKNTLKDLDEFLKQQAATLVEPTSLAESIQEVPAVENTASPAPELSEVNVIAFVKRLSVKNNNSLSATMCHLIIQAMEDERATSAEDKMLINTALYLTNSSDWKEAIKKYWEKH